MAQLVEHILGKDEVISSTLISSSKNPVHICERDFYLLLLTSSLLHHRFRLRLRFQGNEKFYH